MKAIQGILGAKNGREVVRMLPQLEGVSTTITFARKELMQLINGSGDKPAKVAKSLLGGAKHPKLTVSAAAGRGRARVSADVKDGKNLLARIQALISQKNQRVSATVEKGENKVHMMFDATKTKGAEQDLSVNMQRRNGFISFDYRAGKAARLKGKVNEQEAREMAEMLGGTHGLEKMDMTLAKVAEGLQTLSKRFAELLRIAPKEETAAEVVKVSDNVSKAMKNIDAIKKARVFGNSKISKKAIKKNGSKAVKDAKEYSPDNFFAKHLTTDPKEIQKAGYQINEFGEIVKV